MRLRAIRTARIGVALVALSLPLLTGALVTPARASAGTATVYLLQGMPDRNVDMYANDKLLASNVAPKTIVGPLTVAAGAWAISVTPAGSTTALVQRDVTVAAGQSVDAVAHLSADETPKPLLTAFVNDLSPVAGGKVRLAVAHTADVPAADIRVNGKVLFSNVANGEQLTTVVLPGSYSVEIVPTGTSGPAVLGPANVSVAAGTLTRVFAIGQPSSSSMDAIVQVLKVSTSSTTVPTGVDTGSGGRAAPAAPAPLRTMAGSGLIAAGGAVLLCCVWAAATTLRLRRSRA